ncbi:hypothetical protein SPBR_07371 [Sporothrix brasiliensis 5110]|uniref:25S rRNA (Uridine(2843)-N(3))-methyltransferase n=1 Tax=Sporothrix brasiliensis 5110 TaxID=1398154 RepID=A0A0C2FAE7_9PEZI|nr:uncharacterized protein SPBR_07371 [Sporothrix brasiliensis 5110]KIH88048.1 hypothetical protein SPBR_07371 [Sporothrix brasiliensis 5110]
MPRLRGTNSAGSSKNSKLAAHKPPNLKTGAKAFAASAATQAAAAGAAKKPSAGYQQKTLSHSLQQDLLDVFRRALAPALASPRLNEALQAVKQALFERDFAGAFGTVDDGGSKKDEPPGTQTDEDVDGSIKKEGKSVTFAVASPTSEAIPPPLDAYAARWSPTRALCYASILCSPVVQEHWSAASGSGTETETETETETKPALRMVAIGGGAAEIVAFGAMLTSGEAGADAAGDLVLVDSGPWASVVGRLRSSMVEARSDGRVPALVEPANRFNVDVRWRDILKVDDEEMGKMIGGSAADKVTTLITLFFTLNELFTAGGLGAAATFLLRLTAAAPPGTALLVVDSPGSYAEMAVGSQARKYPMRWLLDKFLLQDAEGWDKVHEDEATWFRLSASLSYPIRLEDMRYQMHLYVRK